MTNNANPRYIWCLMQTIELTENETTYLQRALLCYRQELSFVNMKNPRPNTKASEIAICTALLNKLGYMESNPVAGTTPANKKA